MFNLFGVPTTSSVLKQFEEMKIKLSKIVAYHFNAKLEKEAEIANHEAEVAAASKAIVALNQFI